MFMRTREQKGQRIETPTAFFLRYYVTTDGKRVKRCVKLCDKSEVYRSWPDVEPLITRELEKGHDAALPTGSMDITTFVEQHYLPWAKANKAAVTADGYRKLWELRWRDAVGSVELVNLSTAVVTSHLTRWARELNGRTLSHVKWFLSGVYEYAISTGVVPRNGNPVVQARWLTKVARPEKQREYSLAEITTMLRILEPLDLRAAVAVALAYFAALRPCEIRGLTWADYDRELHIRRSVWRNYTGDTKTEGSEGSVPVIEPLRGLLERLREHYGEFATSDAPILQSQNRTPLSLDSLNWRVIAPAMKKAGIVWRGFYPARRGISSLVTDTSKNALNSTGLLRHSTPITALRHYTRAQKDSIKAALLTVEEMATRKETIQ